MMVWEILLLLLSPIFLYFTYTYVVHLIWLKEYPPGPFPIPIIGNLHLLTKRPYETFRDLSKIYGDVFSISIGLQRVVVVNSIEPAKEVLVTKGSVFAGRPKLYTFGLVSRGFKNMGFSDYGPYWITMRKFGHSAFQIFGKADNKLEKLTQSESEFLNKRLREEEGKPLDPQNDIGLSLINVISHICFGHRYSPDDEEFKEIIKFTGLIFAGLGSSDAVSVLPWLRIFPQEGLTKIREGLKIRDPLLRRNVQQHVESFDPDNIRDLTDALLKVRHDEKLLKKAELSDFSSDQIEMIINDIFVGAIETTLSTIRWGILYLLHWPKYQEIMFHEMLQALGPDEYPTANDRSVLPIVQCFIQETLRLSSMAPLGNPHKAVHDATIGGLSIPKDTQVVINHWNCHHDERYWENPEEFNPLRWLNENGEYVASKNTSFIPFSVGRRNCFGETMARNQLFIIFSRLINEFKIEKNPDEPLPDLKGELGITLSPHPFTVIFKSRRNYDVETIGAT